MKKVKILLLLLLFPFISFSQGFTTSNGDLIDNNGNNFIMKGMNVPLAWYANDVTSTLDDVRMNTRSNCLRIVMTTGTNEYTWQNAVMQCIANDMIPMVELHDATGSTSTADVQNMAAFWAQHADFLTQPGVVEYILVNICNEWGTWSTANSNGSQWRDAFNQAVTTIRNAGINTTLIIDAVGYGQDIDDARNIRTYAAGMIDNDPMHNLMFSIHMYCEWAQGGDDIAGTLQWARDNQIPLNVGEFGYQHATDGSCDIDEQFILDQCEANGIGWLAWSQKGNSGGVEYLDLCNDWACTSLSTWGNTVFNGRNGTNTSVTCSVFEDNPGRSPVVTITSPENNSGFLEPANVLIEVTATDSDGSVAQVEFFNGSTLLSTDNSAPYSYNWQNVSAGTYSITAVATDNDGRTSSDDISISVNIPQAAFGGNPWPVPGTIQFENFDVGGNGYAYYDNSAGSETDVTLRDGEDVDIEECTDEGGGYSIGYAISGEWLEYTVNVQQTGVYTLTLRTACNSDGRTISLSYEDGTVIENNIEIPNSGGWQEWIDVVLTDVQLQAGIQVLRVTIGANDYVNLNYLTFELPAELPEINLTSPSNNDSFRTNESITISANAFSSAGTNLTVEFYANNILLSNDNSSPFSFEWSGMTAGEYEIFAIATDSEGSSTSEVVTININEASESVQLITGWNLIGCPLAGAINIETALASIWQYVEVVKDMDAFFNMQQPAHLNSLSEVRWGKGYFVKVSTNCELEW